jgi:hypothetical protein
MVDDVEKALLVHGILCLSTCPAFPTADLTLARSITSGKAHSTRSVVINDKASRETSPYVALRSVVLVSNEE